MAREIISISLSPELRRYVDRDIERSGYTSVSEYFRDLIRARRQDRTNKKRLEDSLVEYRREKARLELQGYRPPDAHCTCSVRDKNGRFRHHRR